MPEVRKERTGWRDNKLSERHRQWGWDCPAMDIDFLYIEYDQGKAIALVEYKHERAAPQYASHPTYQALIDLGDRASLPVIAARYAEDFSWWKITALNSFGLIWVPQQITMNEMEWVMLLYKIRGREMPKSVSDNWELKF